MSDTIVDLRWSFLRSLDDDLARLVPSIYGYAHLAGIEPELLYVGKAFGVTSSVRSRLRGKHKEDFYRDLREQRGIHEFAILASEMFCDRPMTRQLMDDVESLLIQAIDPWGNIQATKTRKARRGLVVRMHGEWPHSRKQFRDIR